MRGSTPSRVFSLSSPSSWTGTDTKSKNLTPMKDLTLKVKTDVNEYLRLRYEIKTREKRMDELKKKLMSVMTENELSELDCGKDSGNIKVVEQEKKVLSEEKLKKTYGIESFDPFYDHITSTFLRINPNR